MATRTLQVADAFKKTDSAWILDDPKSEQILIGVAREIDEFIQAYVQRFHVTPDPFRLLTENPPKAAAFFQSFTGPPHSIEIRLLIWHLLTGADIVSVNFLYQKHGEIKMLVRTETPYGESEEFASSDLWDFRLFRHIGVLSVGEQPMLDGYYPLR